MKLLIVIIALFLVSCVPRGVHRAVADYSGDTSEIWKVQGDASKRLSDYHWFEDQYQQIKAYKANALIQINAGADFAKLDEVIIINRWISDYNGRSRQYDRAMWQSDDLPHEIKLITSVEDLKD